MAKAQHLKKRLPWFKIFADEWLRGDGKKFPIRKEKPITRDVLTGLLAMAADSPYENNDGVRELKVTDRLGYLDEQYCKILNISMEEWLFAKNRLEQRKSIEVNDDNIIKIVNWSRYQTVYERTKKAQKKYRDKLREAGYGTMGEAIAKTFAEQKPDARSILDTLKFLPPQHHEELKKNLNGRYPKGHGFDEAKKLFDDWRKQ
jgi:hypothetical protein